ncbi:MAG: hypothetical protein ACPG7F_20660 [Aggregatilineales bacterium]
MTAEKRYMRRFAVSMSLYVVAVFLSVTILKTMPEDTLLRIPVALLPLLPVIPGMLAYLRYLRSMDELQQRIQLEAFGFSLAMTGLVTFTLGFLENAGLERISLTWVFPMLIMFWGVGQQIAARRY